MFKGEDGFCSSLDWLDNNVLIQLINYIILVNHKPIESIVLRRGFRRGDLLSPFVYIICVEGISTLIKKN